MLAGRLATLGGGGRLQADGASPATIRSLDGCAGEQELGGTNLLYTHSLVVQINGPAEFGDFPCRQLAVRGQILSQIPGRACCLDPQHSGLLNSFDAA